jgi:nuclear transport factor 2 (NTF2) superfamily protein
MERCFVEQASERVLRWKAAWESRDADVVARMYHADATHESALVPRLYPEAGGTLLNGRDQIRAYAARGLTRFTELRFELVSVTESASRATIEYRRHSNVDGADPARVLELVEWDGDLIRTVRVYHF